VLLVAAGAGVLVLVPIVRVLVHALSIDAQNLQNPQNLSSVAVLLERALQFGGDHVGRPHLDVTPLHHVYELAVAQQGDGRG
jgi:hypothetical protein